MARGVVANEFYRGPERKKISNKISLVYFNQIEAFHVKGRWGRKDNNFCLSWKVFEMHFYLCLCFFIPTVNAPDIHRLEQG